MAKRININLSDEAYADLEKLAKRKGKTMSEILREALSLEKWFEETGPTRRRSDGLNRYRSGTLRGQKSLSTGPISSKKTKALPT